MSSGLINYELQAPQLQWRWIRRAVVHPVCIHIFEPKNADYDTGGGSLNQSSERGIRK